MIDANDKERFELSKEELDNLMREPELLSAHLLVLGNKAEIPTAASYTEIKELFQLDQLERPWVLRMVSAITMDQDASLDIFEPIQELFS